MIRLNKSQIIEIHNSLISITGGAPGVRDESLLDSAVESPFQTFDGIDLYPTLMMKAVRLGYSLINNHPFIDGNKRIGIHAMLTFLALNGVEISCSQNDLIHVGLSLADKSMSFEKLLEWLSEHS